MPKDELPKPKRGRRTKVEIQQDFENLANDEKAQKIYSDPKTEELEKSQEQELLHAVQDISAEEMIRKYADFNIEISKILGTLSEKIVGEIQVLAKLRQAVELEKKEIQRLHKIDLALLALDQLIEEHQTKKEEFEQELTQLQISAEKERLQQETKVQEDKENLLRQRKREVDEYEYKKNLERKQTQDKYEEEIRLREKQNKEKQEALEKNWLQRESSLKVQEDELALLKKTVQEYPQRIQKEIDTAVAQAILQTEEKLAHQMELLKRDNDSEKRIAELKIKSLEEALTRQVTQNSIMQQQTEEAKKQVQDIAVKAIEGASGAKAFQIALEQTKTRTSNV